MLAGVDSAAYDVLLVLHILCAIVGFGSLFLGGIYDQQSGAHPGPEGLAIAEVNALVSKIAEYFIYATFVLGVLLVLVGDPVVEFSQTWVWLSTVLFLAVVGMIHGMLKPRLSGIQAIARELMAMMSGGPPPEGFDLPQRLARIQSLGKQVGAVRAGLNVIVIVIIVLMVTQPG